VKNPFKIGEKVLTKVAGNEVDAVVTKLWQNEVQVRTADNEIRWRTMYTVWRAGEAPLTREPKNQKSAANNASANTAPKTPAPTPGKRGGNKKASAKPSKKRC